MEVVSVRNAGSARQAAAGQTAVGAVQQVRDRGWQFVLALTVCSMVMPRAFIDYGQSGDAWDNALDAMTLVREGFFVGVPHLIRFPPGVPLFSYVLMPVVQWGHVATNLTVFAFYLLSVLLFHKIVAGDRHRRILTVLFALTPILITDAAITQDFVCGLSMLLGGYLALSNSRYVLAGFLLGLAIGFRVTNVLFLIPATLFVYFGRAERRPGMTWISVASLWATAIAVGLALYLPIIANAGFEIFVPGEAFGTLSPRTRVPVAAYNLITVFGVIPLIGALTLLCVERTSVWHAIRQDVRQKSAVLACAVTMIALHVALCIRFTAKPDYFIPAIPFVYVLAGRYLSRSGLVLVAALVASYCVVGVELKGGPSGQRSLTVRPAWGLVADDYRMRAELSTLRSALVDLRNLGKAVIITGMGGVLTRDNPALEITERAAISPTLQVDTPRVHRIAQPDVHRVIGSNVVLIATLSRSNVEIVRRAGYDVYMFSEYGPSGIVATFGYDPYAAGIHVLHIFDSIAFYKQPNHLSFLRQLSLTLPRILHLVTVPSKRSMNEHVMPAPNLDAARATPPPQWLSEGRGRV
ncbi:MAG TPA: hypothetical protein VIF83_02405 [Gemmatimonadaceae bacterium]|jgi:hypothetical protein